MEGRLDLLEKNMKTSHAKEGKDMDSRNSKGEIKIKYNEKN